MSPTYLVDTNFFIDAHRSSFPFDVVPSFWAQVAILATSGVIGSIDKVYDEICRQDDPLKAWVESELPTGFFLPSAPVFGAYRQVVQWASSRRSHYTIAALSVFLQADEADAWLVAHSLHRGCPLVTHELSRPEMKRAIKIPEPCNHFGLQFLNTIDLFRALGVRI